MKTTIDYSRSPAASFDAIEDIKDYLGEARFEALSPEMAKVANVRQFSFYCGLAGIEGFPVRAWYELYHGGGAWDRAWDVRQARVEVRRV